METGNVKKSFGVTAPLVASAIFPMSSVDGRFTPRRRRLACERSMPNDNASISSEVLVIDIHTSSFIQPMCRSYILGSSAICVPLANDLPRPVRQTGCMAGTYRVTFIRQWRKFRKLTLQQLAAKTGTDHGNLSRIERGQKPYKQQLLEDIAKALDTTPAALLERDPHKQEEISSIWQTIRPSDHSRAREILKLLAKPENGQSPTEHEPSLPTQGPVKSPPRPRR